MIISTRQNKILFHHQPIPTENDWKVFDFEMKRGFNYTIFLSKTLRQRLHNSNALCNDYELTSKRFWNAKSYIQCYRKCIQYKHKTLFGCIPLFIDRYITELDFDSVDYEFCGFETFSERRNNLTEFRKYCRRICPKDCFNVEYHSIYKKSENYFGNQQWFDYPAIKPPNVKGFTIEKPDNFYERPVERRIVWDTSKPMFAYIDEPVLTFTAYLVYCGGLMGLWFGQSVHDLIVLIINYTKLLIRRILLYLVYY